MRSVRLAIRTVTRTPEATPSEEGEALALIVQRTLEEGEGSGRARPVAVVVRRRQTELLDLQVATRAGLSLRGLLAGLTRSSPEDRGLPVAVGVAGQVRFRGPEGSPVPIGLAFLEWPDCSWWQWQVLLDPSGTPIDDSEIRRSAQTGDPLPQGLGRWWSLGRRSGARVRYGTNQSGSVQPTESPLIH